MDLTFSPKEMAFRDELRDWLAANPPDARPSEGGESAELAWALDWQRRLYDGGWVAPNWPIEYGGRVLISTRNAGGLVAIHEFLRFQITDHKTGDPLEVVNAPR